MLILTSFGFRSPIVREKLKDVIAPEGKRILLVPYAGANIPVAAESEIQGLVEFGFSREMISACGDAGEAAEFDYMYVPEGDPFKLLKTLQENGLLAWLKRIVRNGTVYIGASAGAELAVNDLEYVTLLDDRYGNITDYKGLGLVNDIVLPHADQRDTTVKMKCKAFCEKERSLLCIANDSAAVYRREMSGYVLDGIL